MMVSYYYFDHRLVAFLSFYSLLLLILYERGGGAGAFVVSSSSSSSLAPPPVTFNRLLLSSSATTTALHMSETITLYGHPGTRSPLVNWACLELKVPFQMADDLSQNPHPFGQLPCLVVVDDSNDDNDEDNAVVFESGAILQYLQREYAGNHQQYTKSEIAAITSWITWANASLDPICFLETPDGKVYDTGLKNPQNPRLLQLDSLLGQRMNQDDGGWLVGQNAGFTLADVAVASYLLYVILFFPDVNVANAYPHIAAYMQKCAERDAYGQAFGTATQERLLNVLEQQLQSNDDEGKKKNKLFGMF